MMPPAPPVPPRRRRGSIEIYFVLYLSAIILLLGTTPSRDRSGEAELEAAIVKLLAPDFRVRARNAALFYSFVPAGARIDTTDLRLRRDSVNVIYASGSFRSVDFRVLSIADSASGAAIPLDGAGLVRNGERSALFRWNPAKRSKRGVYYVTVAGFARPLPPTSVQDPELRERIEEILRRHGTVVDSVTFTVTSFPVDQPARIVELRRRDSATTAVNGASIDSFRIAQAAAGSAIGGITSPFFVAPHDPAITSLPGSTWNTRLHFNGATANDLEISTVPAGVRVVSNDGGSFVLAGPTPAQGEQVVTVTARRRSDGSVQQARFSVRAARLDPPSIPETMYEDDTYVLDFGVDGMPGGRISVEAVESGGGVVVPRAEGSTRLRFVPEKSGEVRFNRYVDGRLVDSWPVRVARAPAPSLTFQSNDDGVVAVGTSYSYMSDGRPNIPVLKIMEGNVEEPQPLGDPVWDATTHTWVRRWKISRRDQGRPLELRAYVLDGRGSRIAYTPQTYRAQ